MPSAPGMSIRPTKPEVYKDLDDLHRSGKITYEKLCALQDIELVARHGLEDDAALLEAIPGLSPNSVYAQCVGAQKKQKARLQRQAAAADNNSKNVVLAPVAACCNDSKCRAPISTHCIYRD